MKKLTVAGHTIEKLPRGRRRSPLQFVAFAGGRVALSRVELLFGCLPARR
jgi:hypothetical protein